jgi:amino acid adenylation domain-containing protein
MSIVPANAAQRRFFLLDQIEASAARTLVKQIEVTGNLDQSRLLRAIRNVLQQAPCLRASLIAVDGELCVREHEVDEVPITLLNLNSEQFTKQVELIQALMKPFDHGEKPLCRTLVLFNENKAMIYLAMHHAIFDDYSTDLLLNSLVQNYTKIEVTRTTTALSIFPASDNHKLFLPYWAEVLKLLNAATSLPAPIGNQKSRKRLMVEHPLDTEISSSMEMAVRQRGFTLFSQIAAAASVVLNWYLGQDKIVLMTACQPLWRSPSHGIGCLQNTLPIVVDVSSQSSYKELTEHVQECVLDAYEHGELPIEEIAAQARHLKTMHAGKLLSDVVIVLAEQYRSVTTVGLEWRLSEILPLDTEYPLTVTLVNKNGHPNGLRVEWLDGQFDEKTARILLKHIQGALQKCLAQDQEKPNASILLDDDDLGELNSLCVAEARLTHASTPLAAIIEQWRQKPSFVALVVGEKRITYDELLNDAKRIAGSLRMEGIGAGDRVAIALARTDKLIPVILGILWAGAAFVAIDIAYPLRRIDQILYDAQPALLISEDLQHPGFVTRFPAELTSGVEDFECLAAPDQVMYVLYTSGTTGQPKGVLIENKSVSYFVDAINDRLATNSVDVIAATSLTFDTSILDIFWPLMTGRRIHLTDHKRLLSVNLPTSAVYQCTPTIARTLIATTPGRQFLASLDSLLLSGEKVASDLVHKIFRTSHASVWNCYGPTETTVVSHVSKIRNAERPSIGWTLAGASCHLIDPAGRPLPPGWPGKVIIGGTGLARGYWKREELTEEKFRSFPSLNLVRGYNAGDLAVLDRSLGFEFIGRADNQVKIMGQRVEIEEIELCIRELDWVIDAAVCVVDTFLVAWVCDKTVVQSEFTPTLSSEKESDIRNHLLRNLPSVMAPNLIMRTESLPQSPGGKLDRQILLGWAKAAIEPSVLVSQEIDTSEQLIAEIWSKVIGRRIDANDISHHHTFFQLGGTSAGLILAFDQLAKYYPALALSDLFEHTTLPSLAAFLECQFDINQSMAPIHGRERYKAIARLARRRQNKEVHNE